MKQIFAAFISAILFGLGLGISGMTLPSKVLGFLDVTGAWDPSLIFVMVGAILAHGISYQFIAKRSRPILVAKFQLPPRRKVDWKLILGAGIFGAGWGLAGICPGPSFVNLASAEKNNLFFIGSMVVGIYVFNFLNDKSLRNRGK